MLGIKAIIGEASHDGRGLLIVLWGGRSVRLVRITLDRHVAESPPAVPDLDLEEQQASSDWILDVAIVADSLLLLTAHNQLLLKPLLISENTDLSSRHHKISTISGPKSFLYAGCLAVGGPDRVIVASGTVFGEIVVWICVRAKGYQLWVPSHRHTFQGHTGSVFGVSISAQLDVMGSSKRLLASCSDDRTIKIWDISDCDQKKEGASGMISSTETGFGSVSRTNQKHIASGWGHLSRIWDVDFVQPGIHNTNKTVSLLSRGEDGACQLWTVELHGDSHAWADPTTRLIPRFSDRHHHGKNAWSMCQSDNERGILVHTGGADGQIISRTFGSSDESNRYALTTAIPFQEITGSSIALKNYLLLSNGECLATTDKGQLFRLSLISEKIHCHQLHGNVGSGGMVICLVEELRLILVAHQRGGLFALMDGQDSLNPVSCPLGCGFSWMQVAGQHSPNLQSPKTCVVAVSTTKEAFILWVSLSHASLNTTRTALILPSAFIITACCYDESSGILLLGSRTGALAVYSNVTPDLDTSKSLYCVRHIHGGDSVTSISVLQDDTEATNGGTKTIHILTTGRDGNYAIHRLQKPLSVDSAEPSLDIVHLSSLPFGPNIEGAYLSASSARQGCPDLILYGFRSTSFVVWNETQQSEVLAIECGGSHRSWCFKADAASTPGHDMRSFVWTKTGNLSWHRSDGVSHKVVQRGGHGREIKAVARSSSLYAGPGKLQKGRVLIATGAEDTNIQLFTIEANDPAPKLFKPSGEQPNTQNAFRTLATLKRHTTGLQHLQFSASGGFLFSSAGCEEFFVWKLDFEVPCIGIGVVLWDVMPTTVVDSDARIMSFDFQDRNDSSGSDDSYTISMAYSNGKVKILRYTPLSTRNKGTFESGHEISYGSFCLMQAFFIATPPVIQFEISQCNVGVMSAGTNGDLNISIVDNHKSFDHSKFESEPGMPMKVHKVHQSSILAMNSVPLAKTTHLIATGGDDNALGLTIWTRSTHVPQSNGHIGQTLSHFRTILIPNAHVAALTALKIIDIWHTAAGSSAVVVTAANDQRVKVWTVDVDIRKIISSSAEEAGNDKLSQAVQVKLVGSAWTAVADVSGLELVDGDGIATAGSRDVFRLERSSNSRVLVVGVGMELLSINWNNKEGLGR